MSMKVREVLFDWIQENALSYSIAEVDNKEIDQINILQASFSAMHKALDGLQERPEHILVDGNRFRPYGQTEHTCVIKGDGIYRSIAAASILAKVHRDRLMGKLAIDYPGYGWEKNAGYPTKQHRSAIAKLGVTPLHRLSFRLLPEEGVK